MPYTLIDRGPAGHLGPVRRRDGLLSALRAFAQVRRQRPPDLQLDAEVIDPANAFYAFYDLYRTLVLSNNEDLTLPVETWLICRIAVPEPAEHYFLRGFSRWSVEWVEVVYPDAAIVLTDPALLALQTIEGLREDSLEARTQPGAVRLSAQPNTVPLDLVARQYARAKAGLGSESLRHALHKWGAHLGPDYAF